MPSVGFGLTFIFPVISATPTPRQAVPSGVHGAELVHLLHRQEAAIAVALLAGRDTGIGVAALAPVCTETTKLFRRLQDGPCLRSQAGWSRRLAAA